MEISNGKLRLPETRLEEEAAQTLIPDNVGKSQDPSELGSELVVFSFIDYNQNECGLHNVAIDSKKAKALTGKLKVLSATTRREIQTYFKAKVHNSGKYAGLYNGLGQDVELIEIEYGVQGRIFGYVAQKEFRVVSFDKLRHK